MGRVAHLLHLGGGGCDDRLLMHHSPSGTSSTQPKTPSSRAPRRNPFSPNGASTISVTSPAGWPTSFFMEVGDAMIVYGRIASRRRKKAGNSLY